MNSLKSKYDVAIVGGGHNGLVAACYLAKAGMSVLVLERNDVLGGATLSRQTFPGVDAKLSVYSYLVSLLPQKIIDDLGLKLQLRSRKTASWTPRIYDGKLRELLIQNNSSGANREAFSELTGSDKDYEGYLKLQRLEQSISKVIWPSLISPMISRKKLRNGLDKETRLAWQALIEEPIGDVIEQHISDDLIRGLVFTDGRIGVSTYPHDPSLLQNKSFLYHIIGGGTGEWRVPVGGMGVLVEQLHNVARTTSNATFQTNAKVIRIDSGPRNSTVIFEHDEKEHEVDARFVLCNASAQILNQLTEEESVPLDLDKAAEGAGFKINMLLKKLPRLLSDRHTAEDAFSGTVHIDEGYQQMMTSYQESMRGNIPTRPPGEIYCHTLTDDSILSDDLNQRGYHTLTLFGLDMPYRLFEKDNDRVRDEVLSRYLTGINQFLRDPIEDCLATDCNGAPCVEAMSSFDLEQKVHLPKGNIFHGGLSWPFADSDEEVGQWGVETKNSNILLCGSAAKRGGAVSGIPGHNAAMKVMELSKENR